MSDGDAVTVPRRRGKGPTWHPRPIPEMCQRRKSLPVYRSVSLRSYSVFVGRGVRACRCQCVAIVSFITIRVARLLLFFLTILFSQRDVRTIEGVLFDALVRVGAVSSDNADDPTKVSLGRAARTDAGVHAAGNLVSLKLITQIPGVSDVVAAINNLLPPEIRVWGIVRVQNSFHARTYAPFSNCVFTPYRKSLDFAIVASTRIFSPPTSSYPPSLAVDCTKRSAVRQCRHRTAHPMPAHPLTTFIHSGPGFLRIHQRTMTYKGSDDGALNQKPFRDYGKPPINSRVLATSTTSQ